ncbi:MAG: ATP-dependent Clp protease proteolytic subunit [Patescibacteria group bacterium]|nr:ATP-dependent Clp protease proteolytic subunit [Patescibacteria group bacterium]
MQLKSHELAYAFQEEIVARLRQARVPRAKAVTEDIVPKLMQHVPSEAFDAEQMWRFGYANFHGEVTEDSALAMQDELLTIHLNVKKEIPITLYMTSPGGYCEAGMALVSTIQEIRRAGRVVNCHVQGTAMSMGSIILQACDTRTIEPFATMMIHEITDIVFDKTSGIKDYAAFLERYEALLFSSYAQRSNKPVEFWREKVLRRDVYLTAREAVALGLADKIRPIKPYPSKKKKSVEAPAS